MNEYNSYEKISYKELQFHAKQIHIPANMQRRVLVEALVAHQKGNLPLVENIVNLYKSIRKDKLANKPQNLSVSKKKKAKSKPKSSKEETVVDSTSQEIKDLVSFNCGISSRDTTLPDSKKALCSSDPFPNRMYMNSTPQYQTEFPQWNPGNISNNIHVGSNVTNYGNNSLEFKTPAAFSTPFDALKCSSQNTAQQHFQRPDSATSHYNCSEVYRPNLYCQQTPHNCDFISPNLSYSGATGNYHQLPNASKHLLHPISSSSTPNKNSCVNMCSVPRNNYYYKTSNNTVSQMDIAQASPYLPNIPELADVTVDNIPSNNNPLPWPEDTLDAIESERVETTHDIPNHDVSQGMSSSQNLDFKSGEFTSANLSFDKYSDEETYGLDDDLASMLEINKVDLSKSNAFSSSNNNGEAGWQSQNNFDHFYSLPGNQNSSTTEGMNGSKFPFPNMTVTYTQNCSNDATFGSSNRNNFSLDNMNLTASQTPLAPLPSISTLLPGINHHPSNTNSDVHASHWPSFLEDSVRADSTSAPFILGSSNSGKDFHLIGDSKNDNQNCINLISPSPSPERNANNISILRNRLQTSHASNSALMPSNKNELMMQTRTSLNHVTGQLALSNGRKIEEKGLIISSTPYAMKVQNTLQESKLNMSVGNVVLMKTKSENDEKEDMKTNVSQVIYESETLHRSKIICSVMEEKNLKGERLRQLMQICNLSKEKWKPLTMIKTLEKETLKGTTLAVVPVCRRFCTYKVRGCGAVLRQEYAQRHEKKCTFKPITCPSNLCFWNDSFNLLNQHICEYHTDEIKWRNQYVYLLDRKNMGERTFRTCYQIFKKTIYVLRLRIEDDKCIAAIQYIPKVDTVLSFEKPVNVSMQMYAFCNKLREVSWKGVAQLYTDDENQQNMVLQLNIRNTEFIGLRLVVS